MTSKRKNPCTNWFPGSVKPVRVGVYKRLFPDGVSYSKFDGYEWLVCSSNANLANTVHNTFKSEKQNLAWCGLANDPEKNK